jgi:hypothetical protein
MVANSCLVRHVGEGSIVIVVVKSAAGLLSAERHGYAGSVGEINIRPAIAVIIDQRNTTAHGLHNIFLVGAGEMLEVDVRGGGDVD